VIEETINNPEINDARKYLKYLGFDLKKIKPR